MKLLLDACVWGPAATELTAAGHDVVWAGEWSEDPGDDVILARAHAEGRVVVTLDKDFGTLAVFHHTPHTGILRLVDVSARAQASVCLSVIGKHGKELSAGAIITAGRGRLRIRPPEAGENLDEATPDRTEREASGESMFLDDSLTIESNNWQRAALEALRKLPEDVQLHAGHFPPNSKTVVISIAGEPISEGQESSSSRVEITWWRCLEDKGYPREFDAIYGPGGREEEKATNWPLVSVFGESTGIDEGLFVGRATVRDLQRTIQLVVLEAMFGSGGDSLFFKDHKGRFIRKDGSPILLWQFDDEVDKG